MRKRIPADVVRLFRLGGDYERASLARDFARAIDIEKDILATAARLGEDFAWWLLVIRGRNCIRRCRGLEPLVF